jgi:hypothetical protein
MASKFKSSVEIDGYLSISSGNWIQVPDGTTAQRPGSPAVGMFRYNTTTAEFEGYFGSTPAWGAIGGGGGTVTEAFKTFAVSGQSSIVADGPTDTLTVAAGNNISLTTDAATDTLTIASTGGSGGGTVTIQRNNYTGDGSTVAYGVSSTVVSENNIQIYLDGVYQDKDTFTATGVTVTFGTAPPTGTEIEIMHYVAVDGVIEVDEFVGDGTTTNFSTSLSIINEDATTVFVSGVYQSKLTYQTTGNVVSFTTAPPNGANIEIVHVKALALSGFNKNNFVGTGSQTAFTLNTTVNEENMTFVFLEGIYQDKSTYSISGSTLTFSTAPQSGYNIEVMVLGAISASTNALYTDTFTGDGSTIAYALGITPVDLNAIEVYLNGLYQNVSTLTLSANTVTFATAPPSGVIIEIRSVGFLNSGGTLAPATLTGGTGINVTTNSPNNFTIANTLVGGIDWDTNIKTATFSANPGRGYIVNTTAGEVTINLPAGVPGNIVAVQDYAGTFDTNKLIISSNGSEAIQGSTTIDGECTTENATVYLLYQDATKGWTSQDVSLIPQNTIVNYLVVAGGGGGGQYAGSGGGGAGGLRTSYGSTTGGGGSSESSLTFVPNSNITITIGAGGAGGTGGASQSANGTNSSISHSSITDIISTGGGGGGGYANGFYSPKQGGSGGGGTYAYAANMPGAAAVTSPVVQGYAGGNGWNSSSSNGGGGGGAGAVGQTGTNFVGADGGIGLQSDITGAATYYAGGGGGGLYPYNASYPRGDGGDGGGGNGGIGDPPTGFLATDGSPNTGGGGGGSGSSNQNNAAGTGGSGVVILRIATSLYSGITTGNPTITTDGSNTILTYTASGTYTTIN